MSLADAMIDTDLFEDRENDTRGTHFETEPRLENAANEEDLDDLFGDEDEEADGPQRQRSSPSPSAGREGSEALSAGELQHRKNLEYEEGEDQEENVVELKHAVLSIPNIPMPRSSDGNNWVIRMPNFVKLDSKPFDKETYVGPDQTDETLSGNAAEIREKSMSIKLEVENTIRWRWSRDPDDPANAVRQSNSRIIRWSDGSMSLLLGKEIFDIHQAFEGAAQQTPLQQRGMSSLSQSNSQSQALSQSQSQNGIQGTQAPNSRTNGLSYLVAQHKRPGILQAEAPITGHMTLRPTGMQSETHRMLARAVGQKHSKVARLRLAPDPTVAPELAQIEAMKAAAAVRKPRPPRPRASGGYGNDVKKRRQSYGGRKRAESVWSDEEPEAMFGDSDEEDDEGFAGGSASRRTTRSGPGADGKRGAGEYQTDDFLVADSSEEGENGDSDHGGRKKSKKRKSRATEEGGGGEVDDLEALDAKIAQQEEEVRRRKRREQSGGEANSEGKRDGGDAMDVDMDVESEEEEDFNVRRTGAGSRRKRAIAMEEEEEEE